MIWTDGKTNKQNKKKNKKHIRTQTFVFRRRWYPPSSGTRNTVTRAQRGESPNRISDDDDRSLPPFPGNKTQSFPERSRQLVVSSPTKTLRGVYAQSSQMLCSVHDWHGKGKEKLETRFENAAALNTLFA